jgi:heptaprenyl diphosphate synthase
MGKRRLAIFLVMLLLKNSRTGGGYSKIGVSIAGGVSHNIGQILVAAAVLKSWRLVYYLPVLMVAGLVTGFLIGILTDRVLRIFKKSSSV